MAYLIAYRGEYYGGVRAKGMKRYAAICATCGGKTVGLRGTQKHALRMADGHRKLTMPAHKVRVVASCTATLPRP